MKPQLSSDKHRDMFSIRPIKVSDNSEIASIIRQCLLEFNAAKPGTMYYDPTADFTFEHFQKENSAYFVAEMDGKVVGGGGFYPTEGLPEGIVELARLYLKPEERGKGIGKFIILHCELMAKSCGFQQMYLETLEELNVAIPLYVKLGYRFTDAALGNSGHFGCEIRMLKSL